MLFGSKVKQTLEQGRRRMDICRSCDRFNNTTKLCKECGCFMPAKTKLPNEACPIGKWGRTLAIGRNSTRRIKRTEGFVSLGSVG